MKPKYIPKENKKLVALKIVLINTKINVGLFELLDNGYFKVVPFSNHYYEISLYGYENYYLIYNSDNDYGITIKKKNKNKRKI